MQVTGTSICTILAWYAVRAVLTLQTLKSAPSVNVRVCRVVRKEVHIRTDIRIWSFSHLCRCSRVGFRRILDMEISSLAVLAWSTRNTLLTSLTLQTTQALLTLLAFISFVTFFSFIAIFEYRNIHSCKKHVPTMFSSISCY